MAWGPGWGWDVSAPANSPLSHQHIQVLHCHSLSLLPLLNWLTLIWPSVIFLNWMQLHLGRVLRAIFPFYWKLFYPLHKIIFSFKYFGLFLLTYFWTIFNCIIYITNDNINFPTSQHPTSLNHFAFPYFIFQLSNVRFCLSIYLLFLCFKNF